MQCFSAAMTFNRDHSAGYLANLMGRLFAQALESRLQPLGLRLGAFPALLHLWEQDGLTQKDLVRRLGIEQPTMAATLARMERDGLVIRTPDETDGRVQRIRLTSRARALQAPATAAAEAVNATALAGLSGAERAQFLRLMARVTAALDPSAAPEGTPA
jgi:DNA-binding MarR family transcriptional regulator